MESLNSRAQNTRESESSWVTADSRAGSWIFNGLNVRFCLGIAWNAGRSQSEYSRNAMEWPLLGVMGSQ